MKARSRELLDRAIAAMVAAIDIYNKPNFPYRAESFTILALNSWELLLKAKWLVINNNRLSTLYVRKESGRKHAPYKRTRSGSPFTHSVDYLARKLTEQKVLDENCRKNLEALAELRDTSIHFYNRSPELGERVQEIGMACIKNFVAAVQDWFQEDLSRFNFYLMPLSFVAPPPSLDAIQLNRQEKSFLAFLERLTPEQEDPAARYSVAVNVEVRFVRSKVASAAFVRVTNDPNAPAVYLSEECIRERYPWDYKELTNRCRQRYSDFKENQKYHQLRKSLESDRCFAHERRLDPEKPKPKKTFYSSAILNMFDQHYQKMR
jgi:hypothetical protein